MNTENAEINEGLVRFDIIFYVRMKEWVCMGMDENSMAYVHLAKDDLLGSYPWKGRLDLLNIVLIGISNDEKLGIIKNEYSIPVDDKLRKDMSAMCNLSQGIRENAADNTIMGVIMNMRELTEVLRNKLESFMIKKYGNVRRKIISARFQRKKNY